MFPFWELAIAPVLDAAEALRIVEIGALKGENTVLMLKHLGVEAELHVIDPLPAFDPAEHEAAFPGQYVFHHDISHEVLPHLPPMDAALIDGDHNWYSVFHELRMLTEVARAADAPLPVMILHDVLFPYGRRDLYYEPDRIPEEFRQPYERMGIRMGHKGLHPTSGLNRTLANAVLEGGPRNGVMTAIDDWMAGHDRPLRRVVLPIYFGLAIVVEEERLERQPKLAAALDQLESASGKQELLELSERIRIELASFEQNIFHGAERRFLRDAERYLDLLKGALLNDHYLEHELRLSYIAQCASNGHLASPDALRDPLKHLQPRAEDLRAAHRTGHPVDRGEDTVPLLAYADIGRTRLDHLHRCLDGIRLDSVPGDLIDFAPRRGGSSVLMRGYLDAHEVPARKVWLADPFQTYTPPAPATGIAAMLDIRPDVNQVRRVFERLDLLDDRVRFLQGSWSAILADEPPMPRVALLRIGSGAGAATADILERYYPRVANGGFIIIDADDDPAVQEAAEAFRARRGIKDPVERLDWTGLVWRKKQPRSAVTPATAGAATVSKGAHRIPLAPAPDTDRVDLSVVVVFYDMRREAARTLHSLSRAYQQGIEDLDYEVLVYDNGSHPDQRLDEDFVRRFGPEFRFVDLGDEATPSPTVALNRGIAEARGEAVALMIDGAHVLTPGVLQFGLAGLRTYEPSVVAVQQWYVGPGQQPDMMIEGYDQSMEDRLFSEIAWPDDGYRLFEVSHFIGGRDWFDGMWESNCVFVPRALLEQVGGFDESFAMAGGGFANLELYERIGATPGLKLVTILGEGSFHQVHGGTTTNLSAIDDRKERVASYGLHYAELRGRNFLGPEQPLHYVGKFPLGPALRTKARRMATDRFREVVGTDPDGRPERPIPLPEELKTSMIDAVWKSGTWRNAKWLGEPITKLPTDLMAYQELISQVRPDWVVETGTGNGSRALFLASICELIGHGQVLSIDRKDAPGRPEHDRITYLIGKPIDEAIVAQARAIVGESPHALVILGSSRARVHTVWEFGHYESMVRPGSYVVIEDTVVNGRPVWPGFGPGPGDAAAQILNTRADFAADPAFERYGLTFNPSGFLRRL